MTVQIVTDNSGTYVDYGFDLLTDNTDEENRCPSISISRY